MNRPNPKNVHVQRHGAATVEFAFCIVPLLIILVGIWEAGRLVEAQQVLNGAARAGARAAASGRTLDSGGTPIPSGYPYTVVESYIQDSGLSTAGMHVSINGKEMFAPPAVSPVDWQGAKQFDKMQVQVTLPMSNVRWAFLPEILALDATLTATSDWYSLRDIPVSVTSDTMHN